jgi:hypothetical protein
MAEDRPHLFAPIPSLNAETQLYTQRRSNAEDPANYRFTLSELLQFLQDEYGLRKLVGYSQKFPNHQINTLVWTENGGTLPTDTAHFLFVIEDGVQLDEGNDYTVDTGTSTITINNFISGANYKIIAWIQEPLL